MSDPTLTTLAFLGAAAFVAGLIDAVVGGGGLIQLPALLVGLPGASPAQLLATNKFGSIFGTATSSITYYRRVHPDLRTALRDGASDAELADRWRIATLTKLPGHGIDDPSFLQPSRPMSAIGG